MELWILCFAPIAFLFAAVGHGGASGYLALMALTGLAPAELRPAALTLNVCVASLSTWQYWRAGQWQKHHFWPLIVTSVPMAFIGGSLQISNTSFKFLLAFALLTSAINLLGIWRQPEGSLQPLSKRKYLTIGGGIGLLSGLTGVGGGIFLSPILVLFRFETLRQAAALAAPFIVVNSIAGLVGLASSAQSVHFPAWIWHALPITLIGGLMGAKWGAHHPKPFALRIALASVLGFAAYKFWLLA